MTGRGALPQAAGDGVREPGQARFKPSRHPLLLSHSIPLPLGSWEAIRCALRLSPHEMEISLLVMDGLSNRAIADCLGGSVHTVNTHLERMYRRLGIASRSALAAQLFAAYVRLSDGENKR